MRALSRLRSLPSVPRAWPGKDGSIVFEQLDGDGRLRAGEITALGEVHLADYATDPKIPDLTPGLDAKLVVHRLHRRAVLLGSDRAIKLTRPKRAKAIALASQRLGELCQQSGFAAASVLDHSDSRVDFSLVAGKTLYDLAAEGLPGWEYFAQAWPDLIVRLARLPEHSASGEASVLQQWYDKAAEHHALSEIGKLGSLVRDVCHELTAGSGPNVVVHRDLHDKQLLWDGQRLGLLDLDTAARGEAALDVANLWAHIELRRCQGILSAPTSDRILELLRGVIASIPTDPARVGVYHRAARLRLAFVYAFRPAASVWLRTWVEACLTHPQPDIGVFEGN